MRTIQTNIYKFSELSETAKARAIQKWYENEDYPFLCEDLTEDVKDYLFSNGCEFKDISLLYSLSYSQGDGLCFTGTIKKDGKELRLSHNYRYYFAKSVSMQFIDENGEEVDEIEELKDIYFRACKRAENQGYSILEYRMTNEEMAELCEANGYEFTEDGKRI